MKFNHTLWTRLMLCVCVFASTAFGQSTEFTYQGRLTDNALPANAAYDFEFRLFGTETGDSQVGGGVPRSGIAVSNGIFGVRLDFGPEFDGAARWLEIRVKPSTGTTFVTLVPRQPLSSAPYSVRSLSAAGAASADSLSGSCVLCVTDAQINTISGQKVTGQVPSAERAELATTAGNVSGVVAIANGGTGSSTKNFVDLSTNQTVGGNKTFSGSVGVTGNGGVFNGNGSGLTNLNGANITGGTVTSTQLAPEALPNSAQLKLLGSLRWDLLRPQANFPAGSAPSAIVFDGSNIWVANSGSNNVTKLRVSDGTNLGTFAVGPNPSGLAFDGSNIWVASYNNNTVTKLRASDGFSLGTFPGGTGLGAPLAIAFDGTNLWIADQNVGRVTKLRASDAAIIGEFGGPPSSASLAFDGANIFVGSSANRVVKLRASDGANLGQLSGSCGTTVAFDGSSIWCTTPSGVAKLRPSDGTVLGTFATGITPSAIAFDGLHIWVANSGSNTVTKLLASDGTNLGTFAVGLNPSALAFDGSNVWVTNRNSNTVTRLQPAFLP